MTKTRTLAVLAVAALGLGLAGWAAAGSGRPDRRVEVVRLGPERGAWLGVALADLDAAQAASLKLPSAQGARVERVEPGSPAEKAGLAAGDVVMSFDGERVRSAAQLARLVRETPPGRSVALEAWRGGSARQLTAELSPPGSRERADAEDETFELHMPPPDQLPEAPRFSWRGFGHGLRGFEGLDGLALPGAGPRRLGIAYQEIEGQLARYFKLEGSGLLVTEVDEGSPAAKAGLRAGDVLLSLDARKLDAGRDLGDAVLQAESGKPLLLDVLRDGKKLQVTVTLAEPRPAGADERPI